MLARIGEKELKELERGKMPRILVVDDNGAFLKTVENALRNQYSSYEVEIATNGLEALRKVLLSQEQFNIVVTDMDMQPVNGNDLEIIIGILNRRQITNTRVLLMSDKVEGRPVDFIKKPFSPDELDAKIKEVLERCK